MFVKAISVLGLLLLLNNTGASNCPKCGGKVRLRALFEEDDPVLTKLFGQSLIRPKAIQKPPFNLPLYGSSFKGPCFKRTAIVKPAVIPRPIYIQSDCKTGIGANDSELAAAAATAAQMLTQLSKSNYFNPAPVNLGPAIDVSRAYQQALTGAKPSVPADAVSLALAYKMNQDSFNKKVCEDGLTYGFRKLPIERSKPAEACTSPISEASLYSLNGQIVELKPVQDEASADSLSAEAMDELVDLACDTEINDVNFIKKPSLIDLGYTPAQITKATFVDISPLPSPSASIPSSIATSANLSEALALAEVSVPAKVIKLLETPTLSIPSVVTDPISSLALPETPESPLIASTSPETQDIPTSPLLPTPGVAPVQPNATDDSECMEPDLLPPPLTIEGFKPGGVIYKDLADSELKQESSNSEIKCESQEEVVTHVPVPAPPCGCLLDDLLEGIRTYSRSRASNYGSKTTHRKSDKNSPS